MTAQINDKFIFNGHSYDISAIQLPCEFFCIEKLGIFPTEKTTACWRGYVAEFAILENRLVLKDLTTNNGKRDVEPVVLNGISPFIIGSEKYQDWYYENINLEISYSGAILITDGFLREYYVHMGFQSPFSYTKVVELIFEHGLLISTNDLSDVATKFREEVATENHESRMKNIPLWINECFDLSYHIKWNRE